MMQKIIENVNQVRDNHIGETDKMNEKWEIMKTDITTAQEKILITTNRGNKKRWRTDEILNFIEHRRIL